MKRELLACGIMAAAGAAWAGDATVDFSKDVGPIRPALHSSGWTPRTTACSNPQSAKADIDNVKAMNMMYARTHDWALVNSGQRVVDLHFIFPLMHLDAKDPRNYCFGPTDHLLGLARETGLEIFYRLGTSIEHTGPKVHFNSRIPEDFDKVAEVFAGTVRHYNEGWGADGKRWGIKYWEIWNEPDGTDNMWCLPEGDEPFEAKTDADLAKRAKRWGLFFDFYVKCLKRLKSEFPDIKVGGPATCFYREDYLRPLLAACREAGVAPDFISWHGYSHDAAALAGSADKARALCDEYGFTKCELILNEWHYMDSAWTDLRSPNPAVSARVQKGPTGHNNIDSAAFTLSALARFQTSKLDQAYYYGCGHAGHWGYMDENKQKNKNFYACTLFGSIMHDYGRICASQTDKDGLTTLAVKAADGRCALLIVDYRGVDQVLTVDVKGLPATVDIEATVLDDTRDNMPADVRFKGGKLTLVKPDKYSSAWLVRF